MTDLDALRGLDRSRLGNRDLNVTLVQGMSAAVTTTTPVEVIAAPGAGLSLRITKMILTNTTTNEVSRITIQDDSGTPVTYFTTVLDHNITGATMTNATREYNFDPPLTVTENQALDAVAAAATGDVYVSAWGWSGAT